MITRRCVVSAGSLLSVAFLLLFAATSTLAEDKKFSQKIRYATSDWIPYCYINAEGEPVGLYVDILKAIFEEEMGIELEYRTFPWKRAQVKLETGEMDFTVTIATQSRLEYTIKTETPVLEQFLYVYTYKSHPKSRAIDMISTGMDIKKLNLKPVTNIGNNWHQINIDNFGVKTYYVPEEKNAFKVLAARRADLVIEPRFAANYLIGKLGLKGDIKQTQARFGPLTFHILISKKSYYAGQIEQINQVVKKVVTSKWYEALMALYKDKFDFEGTIAPDYRFSGYYMTWSPDQAP